MDRQTNKIRKTVKETETEAEVGREKKKRKEVGKNG